MTYSTTKFEVATSKGLGGDTFTRNVTDGQADRQTDGRRSDFDTKLKYPFFLKKKAGIMIEEELFDILIFFVNFSFENPQTTEDDKKVCKMTKHTKS